MSIFNPNILDQTDEQDIFAYTRTIVLASSLMATISYNPEDGGTYQTLINKDPIDDTKVDKNHTNGLRYVWALNLFLLVFIQIRVELYKRKVKVQVVPMKKHAPKDDILDYNPQCNNFQYDQKTVRIVLFSAMVLLVVLLIWNVAGKKGSSNIMLGRLRRRVLAMFILNIFIPLLLITRNPNLSSFCAQFFLSKLSPHSRPIRSNGRYIKTNRKFKVRRLPHVQKILRNDTRLIQTSKTRSNSLPNLFQKSSCKRNSITLSLPLSPPIPILKNLSLEDGEPYAFFRLKKLGLKKSPTQPETPPDGNCMVHAILDQMRYDPAHAVAASTLDHHQLRVLIATSLLNLIDQGKIDWNNEILGGTPDDWIREMKHSGTYCDEVFLTAACFFLHRSIITYPVFVESDCDRIINPIGGIRTTFEPFHLLLYSDAHFQDPHYQSVRPEVEQIPTPAEDLEFPPITVVQPCE